MTTTPRWLERAARSGSERPWTMGSVLEEYCASEGVTRQHLAALLGCSSESLAWLSLCRRPGPEQFAEDVNKIAERFQIEPAKLAQIVRRVDAVAVLRRPRDVEEGDPVLLAARDRDEEKDE
jgi:hypothetical protein